MTMLDAALVAVLVAIASGGYRQGCVRGMVRLVVLALIGGLSVLLLLLLPLHDTLGGSLVQAGVIAVGMVLIAALLASVINRKVTRHVHQARWNRILGVVPALVQGVVLASLVVGLAYRLAITPELQHYIAQGWISGPLSEPVVWLERTAADW
jgi:uncharacterized membrane protein required for colicin V production